MLVGKTPVGGLEQGGQTFSVRGQLVNILGFVGCTVCVLTTQLCHCGTKAARHNTEIDECGCDPVKRYLQKTGNGPDLAQG